MTTRSEAVERANQEIIQHMKATVPSPKEPVPPLNGKVPTPDSPSNFAIKFSAAFDAVVIERDKLQADLLDVRERLHKTELEREALRGLVSMLEDRIRLHGAEVEKKVGTYQKLYNEEHALRAAGEAAMYLIHTATRGYYEAQAKKLDPDFAEVEGPGRTNNVSAWSPTVALPDDPPATGGVP